MGKNTITIKLNEMGIPSPVKYRIMNYPEKKKYNHEYANSIMGLWSIQSINSILQNPLYCGHMAQGKREFLNYKSSKQIRIDKDNWIIVENTHEPIIEEKMYLKVQELFEIRTKPAPDTGKVYLFSGLLKCADCNRTMDRVTNRKPNGKVYVRYRCSTHFRRSKYVCTRHSISENDLYEIVLNTLKFHISATIDVDDVFKKIGGAKKRKIQMEETIEKHLVDLQNEIKSIENIRLGLYTDLKKNIITQDEYTSLKTGYSEKMDKLKENITALEKEREKLDNQEDLHNEWLERFKELRNIDTLTRGLVVELIDKIYVHEGNRVTIKFKFQDEFEKIISYIALKLVFYLYF